MATCVPDEWSSSASQGCGQNPAYRPAGDFFFFLKELPLRALNLGAKDHLQAIDFMGAMAGEGRCSDDPWPIAFETIC
jgi:hypothetical protein